MSLETKYVSSSQTEIPVDNSISETCYRISLSVTGSMTTLLLHSPNNEIVVDLFDNSSLINSGLNFEVVYQGASLVSLSFRPHREGIWILDAEAESIQHTIDVAALCTFNFLADFYRLDWDTTHPNLALIHGQPIASECH